MEKAQCCKTFIEEYTDYELHPDYEECFNQPSGSLNNEIILARNLPTMDMLSWIILIAVMGLMVVGTSNGPSQNLVDD